MVHVQIREHQVVVVAVFIADQFLPVLVQAKKFEDGVLLQDFGPVDAVEMAIAPLKIGILPLTAGKGEFGVGLYPYGSTFMGLWGAGTFELTWFHASGSPV